MGSLAPCSSLTPSRAPSTRSSVWQTSTSSPRPTGSTSPTTISPRPPSRLTSPSSAQTDRTRQERSGPSPGRMHRPLRASPSRCRLTPRRQTLPFPTLLTPNSPPTVSPPSFSSTRTCGTHPATTLSSLPLVLPPLRLPSPTLSTSLHRLPSSTAPSSQFLFIANSNAPQTTVLLCFLRGKKRSSTRAPRTGREQKPHQSSRQSSSTSRLESCQTPGNQERQEERRTG